MSKAKQRPGKAAAGSKLRMTSLRLDVNLLDGLRQVKERDGVAITEQIRRASREWLKQKGIKTGTKGGA
jgi:hypothetical protein